MNRDRATASSAPARRNPVAGAAAASREADRAAKRAERARSRTLWPCIAFLVVEYGRPMAWIPMLEFIKPGMLVSLWGFGAVLLQRNRPQLPKPIKYILGLLVLMAWNIPWATNNRWALLGAWYFALLILGGVIPISLLVSDLGSMRKLLTTYVALHIPMCAYGLFHNGYGPAGWLLDNNDLALVLNAGLGLSFFLFLESATRIMRIFLAAVMTLLVAGVVVSMSRGGFVGLAVLAVFIFAVTPGKRKLVVAACLVTCVGGIFLFAPTAYFDRIKSIETATDRNETGGGRLYAWGIAWQMFLDHPIFGVGTENYGIEGPKYEDLKFAEAEHKYIWGRAAHSIYFTLLSEQGIVGAILFAMIVAWTFSAARRMRRRARSDNQDHEAVAAALFATGLLSAIVGVLVSGVFLSVLYYPVLWVLVGLMAAVDRLAPSARRVSASVNHAAPAGALRSLRSAQRVGLEKA